MRHNPPRKRLEAFNALVKTYDLLIAIMTEELYGEFITIDSKFLYPSQFFNDEVNAEGWSPEDRPRWNTREHSFGDPESPEVWVGIGDGNFDFSDEAGHYTHDQWEVLRAYHLWLLNHEVGKDIRPTMYMSYVEELLSWKEILSILRSGKVFQHWNARPDQDLGELWAAWATSSLENNSLYRWIAKALNFARKKAKKDQKVFSDDRVAHRGYAHGTDPEEQTRYRDAWGDEIAHLNLPWGEGAVVKISRAYGYREIPDYNQIAEFGKMVLALEHGASSLRDYFVAADIDPLQQRLSVEKALEDCRAWHVDMHSREGQPDEITEGELVLELPSGNTVWWLREVSDFETEGWRMGHCIGEGGKRGYYYTRSKRGEKQLGDKVPQVGSMRSFSFRDGEMGVASVTYAVQAGQQGWVLHQAKGRKNRHPGMDFWDDLTSFHEYMHNSTEPWCLTPTGLHSEAEDDLGLWAAVDELMQTNPDISRPRAKEAVLESLGFWVV